jgi:hypothetical protein
LSVAGLFEMTLKRIFSMRKRRIIAAFEEVYKLDRNVHSKLSFGDLKTPKGKIFIERRDWIERNPYLGYRDSVRDYSYLWTLVLGAL